MGDVIDQKLGKSLSESAFKLRSQYQEDPVRGKSTKADKLGQGTHRRAQRGGCGLRSESERYVGARL